MEIIYHGVGHYEKGTRIGAAFFRHYDIIVVLDGQVQFAFGNKNWLLTSGDAWVIPPMNRFEGQPLTDRATIWVLHYRGYGSVLRRSSLTSLKHPFSISNACSTPFSRMILAEITLKWKTKPGHQRTRILAALAETLLLEIEGSSNTFLIKKSNKLKSDIIADLEKESHLNVRDLAVRSGISASYFRQEFRRVYETSPRDFVQQKRMEKAKQLLSETSYPIKQIGQRLGYSAVTSFHRAFLREEKMTPAAYRATISQVT